MTAAERQRRRRAKYRDSEPVTKPAGFRDVTELEQALAAARSEIEGLRRQVGVAWRFSNLKREDAMLILRCLHPDSRKALSDEMLSHAFIAFRRLMEGNERERQAADDRRRADEAARQRNSERSKAVWAKRKATRHPPVS
jgi:hypothetical protein